MVYTFAGPVAAPLDEPATLGAAMFVFGFELKKPVIDLLVET